MTDRVVKITTKELQEIYRLVGMTKSWESVKWHRYPTVPGHDPEKQGMIKIKASKGDGIGKYVFEMQKGGNARKAQCDVHISCKGGFVPCHRAILMHFSPLLKDLIIDNMKETGVPTPEHPIFIAMKDFTLDDMELALSLFYTGFTSFQMANISEVLSILGFLKVAHNSAVEPFNSELMKKRKELVRYKDLTGSGDENEGDEAAGEKAEDEDENRMPDIASQRESRTTTKNKPGTSKNVTVSPARSSSVSSYASNQRSKNGSPIPGTSKDSGKARKRLSSSRDSSKRRDESDPDDSESSSDLDDLFEKVFLTPKQVREKMAAAALTTTASTTLAERVKLKNRVSPTAGTPTPEKKKSVPFTVNMSKRRSEKSNSPNSRSPVQHKRVTKELQAIPTATNLKCYFCSYDFPTEAALVEHADECGAEFKNLYVYKTRKCLLCSKHFEIFSHFGLCRHVVEVCRKINGDRPQGSRIRTVDDIVARDDASGDGDVRQGFERFPLGIPIVVIERIGDSRVPRILESVERGEKVDIPRLPGYNYVKGSVKKEPPDLTPGLTEEELMERKRILELEQEESRKVSEERRRVKARKIPPLRINRERILSDDEDLERNAQTLFDKLTQCPECAVKHEKVDLAVRCVKSHGLKRCLICLKLLRKDSPIDNHYRTTHNNARLPGEVLCPICKVPCKYANLARHLNTKHFRNLETSLAGNSNDGSPSDTAASSCRRRCTNAPVSYAEKHYEYDSNDELYFDGLTSDGLVEKNTQYEAILEKYGPDTPEGLRAKEKMELVQVAWKKLKPEKEKVSKESPATTTATNRAHESVQTAASSPSKKKTKPVSRPSGSTLHKIKIGPKSRMQALANGALIHGILSKEPSSEPNNAPVNKPTASKRKIGPKSRTRGRPKKQKINDVPVPNPAPVSCASSTTDAAGMEFMDTRHPISDEVQRATVMAQMINERIMGTANMPTSLPETTVRFRSTDDCGDSTNTGNSASPRASPLTNESAVGYFAMDSPSNISGIMKLDTCSSSSDDINVPLSTSETDRQEKTTPVSAIEEDCASVTANEDDDSNPIKIVSVTGCPDSQPVIMDPTSKSNGPASVNLSHDSQLMIVDPTSESNVLDSVTGSPDSQSMIMDPTSKLNVPVIVTGSPDSQPMIMDPTSESNVLDLGSVTGSPDSQPMIMNPTSESNVLVSVTGSPDSQSNIMDTTRESNVLADVPVTPANVESTIFGESSKIQNQCLEREPQAIISAAPSPALLTSQALAVINPTVPTSAISFYPVRVPNPLLRQPLNSIGRVMFQYHMQNMTGTPILYPCTTAPNNMSAVMPYTGHESPETSVGRPISELFNTRPRSPLKLSSQAVKFCTKCQQSFASADNFYNHFCC